MLWISSAALLALSGCGGTLSNEVFYDDAEFLAALPSREVFQVWYIDSAEMDKAYTGQIELYELTASAILSADLYLEAVTEITDTVRTIPPNTREEDYRLWGPYEDDSNFSGYYLQVEMTRSLSGGSFTYHFSAAESPSGPFLLFFTGHHYAGETVEEGDGSLEWFVDRLGGEGTLTIEYNLREALSVLVVLDGVRMPSDKVVSDARWYHTRSEDGGGELEYTASLDIAEDPEVPEELEVLSRWNASGEGRGDALFTGGDLEDGRYNAFQCWTLGGDLTAQGSDYSGFATIGDPKKDCPYPDAAGVENL